MNNINFNMGQKDGIWLVIDLIRELKYDNEFCNFYMNIEKEDVVIQMMDKLEERTKQHFSEELNYGKESGDEK